MPPASFSAWLVDLDGTLYKALPLKAAMAAEVLFAGPSTLRILRRFRKEHELLRESMEEDAASPFDLQVERTAQAVGASRQEVESAVWTWMVRRPSRWIRRFRRTALIDEIGAFRRDGGRTALVSDYPATDKLAALGASDLFDVVVANGEPGGPPRLKPHPAGFLLAAEKLGVSPDGCLVIGDRDDADGAAARAAGMSFRKVG